MKRDLKINYGTLKDLIYSLKTYQKALEDVEGFHKRFEEGLLDYESDAVEKLREKYGELLKDMKSCQDELTDLHTIFSEYVDDMTFYIKPKVEGEMMRVSRNDIWWNIETIGTFVDGVETRCEWRYFSDLVPWYTDESKRKKARQRMENNYQKVDGFKNNYFRVEVQEMKEHMDAIRRLHKEKVIPYENMDDSYKKKASQLFNKYTNPLERVGDALKRGFDDLSNFCMGALKAVCDFIVGIVTLVGMIMLIDIAGIAWYITLPYGFTPEWADNILRGAGDTIGKILYDPMLLVEGIAQNANDAVEEKGIAYATGYIVGDVATSILVSKGIDKLTAGSKASAFGKMSPQDAMRYNQYWDSLSKGTHLPPGMTAVEYQKYLYGLNKVDEALALQKVDYSQVLDLRKAASQATVGSGFGINGVDFSNGGNGVGTVTGTSGVSETVKKTFQFNESLNMTEGQQRKIFNYIGENPDELVKSGLANEDTLKNILKNLKEGSRAGKEGFILEAETAKALLENGIPITEGGVKYNVKSLGGTIGEIDLATSQYIIECYNANGGASNRGKAVKDFYKYFSGSVEQPYINPQNKEVILFAPNGLDAKKATDISSLGVNIVTSMEDLIDILKGVK